MSLFILHCLIFFLSNKHIHALDIDANRDTVQLIESRGFTAETHYVTTDDGYILTVHRIRNPYTKVIQNRRMVILQHGLGSSSRDFVINSAGEEVTKNDSLDICDSNAEVKRVGNNLGFVLSKLGLDVWMPNTRGNLYSINHTKLSTSSPEFWKFTFDQAVEYDLPAYIKYILSVTNQKTLSYIGHSEGGFLGLGLLSQRPEYADIIVPYVGMAPVYTQVEIKAFLGLPRLLPYSSVTILRNQPGPLIQNSKVVNQFLTNVCNGFGVTLCINLIGAFGGYNTEQLNTSRYHVYFQNYPSQTSVWNLAHYGQLIISQIKAMQKFDLGLTGNMEKYGQPKPPLYDFSRIRSKYIAIMHGLNDYLVTPKQIELLRKALKVKLMDDYLVPDNKWTHFDFLWAKDLGKLVLVRVVKNLRKVLCEL